MYEYRGKVTRVVDGDTLDISIDLGFDIHFDQRFRLFGINTPEIHGVKKGSDEYLAGMKAKAYVERMLTHVDHQVIVRTFKDKTGKYGRYLAEILPYVPKDDVIVWAAATLNETLVKTGHAERKEY